MQRGKANPMTLPRHWLRRTLRLNVNTIAKQALQQTPQGHRTWRSKNTWKRDLDSEMWTSGFKYSWRKLRRRPEIELYTTSGLWPVLHLKRQGINHASHR